MNRTSSTMKTAALYFLTGERVRIKNQTITCPACSGREYIIGLRGTVALSGEKRFIKLDDSHRCPHCGFPGAVVEAEE